MRRRTTGVAVAALLATLVMGCAETRTPDARRAVARPLLAGVGADSPPYGWVQNGTPTGLEVDFAGRLGAALGREVRVVALPFDELFSSLSAGRIDIAMAGLSVTRAREATMAFSDPYLHGGLLAAMRREDKSRYTTVDAALAAPHVGVVSGTTGAAYVQTRVESYRVLEYRRPRDAFNELQQRRVDVVVHDGPIVVWFASGNDALAVLPVFLQREDLAWAMRYDDAGLRNDVNAALAAWKTDGTLDEVIGRWLPYWSKVRAQ